MNADLNKAASHFANQILQDCADLDAVVADLEPEAFDVNLTPELHLRAMARYNYLREITRRLKGHARGLEFASAVTESE